MEHRAGMVAGEGPPRAVCAAKSRRQADDKQACSGVAEGRNRSVVPVGELPPVVLPESDQPGTKRTIRNWLAAQHNLSRQMEKTV
jgi:hypothetical protein